MTTTTTTTTTTHTTTTLMGTAPAAVASAANNSINSSSRSLSVPQNPGTRYERICQPVVVVVALGLNLPSFIFAMMSIGNWCPYYSSWLLANGIICLVNIGGAWYAAIVLRKKMRDDHSCRTEHMQWQLQQQSRAEATLGATTTTTTTTGIDENEERNGREDGVEDGDRKVDDKNVSQNGPTQSLSLSPNITTSAQNISGPVDVEHATSSNHQRLSTPEEAEEFQAAFSSSLSPSAPTSTSTLPPPRRSSLYAIQRSRFQLRILSRRTQSSNRLRHLICYDGFITTYAIIFLFWIVWLANGAQLQHREDQETDTSQLENCTHHEYDFVTSSLTLGYAYCAFLVASVLLSFVDVK